MGILESKSKFLKKQNLLLVTGSFPDSKQVFITLKIIGLARSGNKITVLTPYPGNKQLLKETLKNEPNLQIIAKSSFPAKKWAIFSTVPYLFIPIKIAFSAYHAPKETLKLTRKILSKRISRKSIKSLWLQLDLLINSRKADLIHFEWNNQAISYLESIQVIRKPIIVSIRGRGITSQPLLDFRLADDLPRVFMRANAIHSISNALVEMGIPYGVDPKKVTIINPAVDLHLFTPPAFRDYSVRPLRIITVAHLKWNKNLIGAIQAIKILIERGYDITYEIIGDGPEQESHLYAIQDLGLANRVILHGYLPHSDIINHLYSAHIFLMPSIQEGFCNSVIEAQAMELPVVVSDTLGLVENIENNVTGFVAKRWNVSDMADKIERLINDSELCVRFGKAGRERSLRLYSIEHQIVKFELLYQKLNFQNDK